MNTPDSLGVYVLVRNFEEHPLFSSLIDVECNPQSQVKNLLQGVADWASSHLNLSAQYGTYHLIAGVLPLEPTDTLRARAVEHIQTTDVQRPSARLTLAKVRPPLSWNLEDVQVVVTRDYLQDLKRTINPGNFVRAAPTTMPKSLGIYLLTRKEYPESLAIVDVRCDAQSLVSDVLKQTAEWASFKLGLNEDYTAYHFIPVIMEPTSTLRVRGEDCVQAINVSDIPQPRLTLAEVPHISWNIGDIHIVATTDYLQYLQIPGFEHLFDSRLRTPLLVRAAQLEGYRAASSHNIEYVESVAEAQEGPTGIHAGRPMDNRGPPTTLFHPEPRLQGALNRRHSIASEKFSYYVKHSNFPSIIIGLAGLRLTISVSIFTDSLYVDHLRTFDLTPSRDLNAIVSQTARVFVALQAAFADFKAHYDSLDVQRPPSVQTASSLFPHPIPRDALIELPALTFIGKLSRRGELADTSSTKFDEDRSYILYLAKLGPSDSDVVVKFTPTYHEGAHRLLAEHQLAPHLHGVYPVQDGFLMVVMEKVEGPTAWAILEQMPLPSSVLEDVGEAVRLLHEQNLVHGDLRSPNIIVPESGKAKIIDFDWTAEEGKGRYPVTVGADPVGALHPQWHPGVQRGGLMMKVHDEFLRDKLRHLS